MKLDTSKYEKLEGLRARREQLTTSHKAALAVIDAEIAREHLVLQLGPYVPPDGSPKGKSAMAISKSQQHADVRAEAIRRGLFHTAETNPRRIGKPNVELVRQERTAKKLGISIQELQRRETAARAETLAKKLKALKVGKSR
jgi:hypothetical protein